MYDLYQSKSAMKVRSKEYRIHIRGPAGSISFLLLVWKADILVVVSPLILEAPALILATRDVRDPRWGLKLVYGLEDEGLAAWTLKAVRI